MPLASYYAPFWQSDFVVDIVYLIWTLIVFDLNVLSCLPAAMFSACPKNYQLVERIQSRIPLFFFYMDTIQIDQRKLLSLPESFFPKATFRMDLSRSESPADVFYEGFLI